VAWKLQANGPMTRLAWLASVSLLGFAYIPSASAATVDCEDAFGSCTVINDYADSVTCECSGAGGESASVTGESGTNEWEGLSEAELLVICEERLTQMCNPGPVPEEGIPCENAQGRCVVDNDPADAVFCACNDGSGGGEGDSGGSGGGNGWAGLSEQELQEVCFEQLDSFCPVSAEVTTDSATTDTGVNDDTSGPDDAGATSGTSETEGTTGAATAADTGNETAQSGEGGDGSPGGTTTGVADTGSGAGSAASADGGGGDASSGADDAAADADEDMKGCRVDPRGGAPGGAMLVLLAALGLRRRRAAG